MEEEGEGIERERGRGSFFRGARDTHSPLLPFFFKVIRPFSRACSRFSPETAAIIAADAQ
eukprot:2218724-Rhodomonas_salina.1